MLTKRESSNL